MFVPAPTNFAVDSSSSSLSSIVLQWNIPYEQVPPDSFFLEYNLTKLSGEPASQTQFSVWLNDSNRTYTVENPLSYTQYEFRLFAFYGDDQSAGVTTSHQTPEASKLDFVYFRGVFTVLSFQWSFYYLLTVPGRNSTSEVFIIPVVFLLSANSPW